MVPVCREACRERRDIEHEVGFHHDDAWYDDIVNMTIQKVELHPLAQYLAQIGKVTTALGVAIVNRDLTILGIGIDGCLVERTYDAAHIALIDLESLWRRG